MSTHLTHADLGGRDLPGAIVPEPEGELFHAAWEPRALALTLAMGATGCWNLDTSRAARESLPDYASSSYYRIWITALERLLRERGLVTPEELEAGRALAPAPAVPRVLKAADVPAVLAAGSPTERLAPRPAAFAVGQRVRTRCGPFGHHVRLPAYLQGKVGTIERVNGAHVFPTPTPTAGVSSRSGSTPCASKARPCGAPTPSPGCGCTSMPSSPTWNRVRSRAWSRASLPPEPARAHQSPMHSPDSDPIFREPWEASAFALAVALHARGVFTWPEWAAALAKQIARAQSRGEPDTGERYYHHWLATLEQLLAERGLAPAEEVHLAEHAWARAAARTPHGQPITLEPGDYAGEPA